jgi:hypothetical protein
VCCCRLLQADRLVLFKGSAKLAELPPYLIVQMVRFFYKVDVRQKAKILRKVRVDYVLYYMLCCWAVAGSCCVLCWLPLFVAGRVVGSTYVWGSATVGWQRFQHSFLHCYNAFTSSFCLSSLSTSLQVTFPMEFDVYDYCTPELQKQLAAPRMALKDYQVGQQRNEICIA